MNATHWDRVKEIFETAVEMPIERRSDFLSQACQGDDALRREVESLLDADANAGGFLDSAWLNPKIRSSPGSFSEFLVPGDVICGRFEIIRPLGDGGMGQVYQSLDSTLGIQVALKIIRPEISNNAEALARFRQEVRLALRITHPNVCRTFHMDREVRPVGPGQASSIEITFLTMEYLDGETLRSLLKRTGRLDLERALAIAKQIAQALTAAHAAGIIHRDIKPANVMIVPVSADSEPANRVVVTDFGLARIETVSQTGDISSISLPGRAVGTLAYMAPEQLQAVAVTPATDIYSFGLVLYEMVTGERAFPDSSSLVAASLRITQPPPSARAQLPALPDEWEAAIQGCLQIDPASRYQHAADVIAVLHGEEISLASREAELRPLTRRRARSSWSLRRTLVIAMSVVLVTVALFAVAFRLYQLRADSKVAAGALVYLAPVRNKTGDKSLDNVTELVRAGLTQSAHINLLDSGRVGDILQQMIKPPDTVVDPTIAREIAMRAGAVRVIFSTVNRSNGRYRLDVDIQQPDNNPSRYRDRWSNSWTWQSTNSPISSDTISPELLAVVRASSDWVRHEVGESASDIARLDAPPEDVTTGNWQALAEYANAERLAARRDPENAIIALQNAIVADPDFAVAYARMGDLLISLSRAEEGYRAYNRALSADLNHRLTRKERDFIKGAYANDTGDYDAGEAAFRDYAAYYENDYSGIFFRAYPLRMLGRFNEAVSILKRAHEISPTSGGVEVGLAYNYMLLGNHSAAQRAIDDLTRLNRTDEADMLSGHLAFLEGRYSDAEHFFRNLQFAHTAAHRSMQYSLLARLAAEQGRFQDAIRELDAGIEADRLLKDKEHEASKLIDRAYLYCGQGDTSSCLADLRRAIDLDSRPENLIQASSVLGRTISGASADRVKALIPELIFLRDHLPTDDFGVLFDVARLRISGELLLARGTPQEALVEFRKASNLESTITSRQYLARALIAEAKAHRNTQTRARLLQEACDAYGVTALKPQSVWYYSQNYPPGFLADEMKDYLNVTMQLGSTDGVVRQAADAYTQLRKPVPSINVAHDKVSVP